MAPRTAQTPEAGLGAAAMTAQSPLAKICWQPSTRSRASVRRRPSPSTGRPLAVSQSGPRLPVQSSRGPMVGPGVVTRSIEASDRIRCSKAPGPFERVCSRNGRWGQRRRSARTTSMAAAPVPTTVKGIVLLGSSEAMKARAGSRGLIAMPSALGLLMAPTSRLSRPKWRGGRFARTRQRWMGSSPVISACTKDTPARSQRDRRSMASASGGSIPAIRAGTMPE